MSKKISDLIKKNKSLKKTDKIEIAKGYYLPLRSLSALEMLEFEIKNEILPPAKTRKMTKEEKEEFLKNNKNISEAMIASYKVAYFDFTDKEYLEKLQKEQGRKNILNYLRYVDLEYEVEKDLPLWKDLGLKDNKDYEGLMDLLFNKLELDQVFLKNLIIKTKALEGETVYDKLAKVEEIYKDKSLIEILDTLLEKDDESDEL